MRDTFFLDTSVFMNVLDIPGKNQDRDEVLAEFEALIEANSAFLLTAPVIYETARHISFLSNGNMRRKEATKFVIVVREALSGEAPWKPMGSFAFENLEAILLDYPDSAMRQLSMADHSIVHECLALRGKLGVESVFIWSLDDHLSAHGKPN